MRGDDPNADNQPNDIGESSEAQTLINGHGMAQQAIAAWQVVDPAARGGAELEDFLTDRRSRQPAAPPRDQQVDPVDRQVCSEPLRQPVGLHRPRTVPVQPVRRRHLRRLATTPVQPSRLLAAQLVVAGAIASVAIALILTIGAVGYHMRLPGSAAGTAITLLLTAAALFPLGLWVAAPRDHWIGSRQWQWHSRGGSMHSRQRVPSCSMGASDSGRVDAERR